MSVVTTVFPEKMTTQEVFDYVTAFILKQNKKSMSEDGFYCTYRGKDNTACAVGCLIQDDEYKPEMEGIENNVIKLVEMDLLPKRLIEHVGLLRQLQMIHDRSSGTEYWTNDFNAIAIDFRLKPINS